MNYRVLDGPCAGQIVTDADLCECDEGLGGCGGSGIVTGSTKGDIRGFDSVMDWEADCEMCDGLGKVLGYPDHGDPYRVTPCAP